MSSPHINTIKQSIKTMWSTGDFGVLAKILEPEEIQFVRRLNIPRGAKVLDVACGSGTMALEAARGGAAVNGIDIVEDLIRQSKENAAAERLNIDFTVGDAEAMPYGDNEFDYVLSMFGAMFGPRPGIIASELARTAKPGGTIVMGNWTKEGFGDSFFKTVSAYAPPPPPGASVPMDWGNESIAEERFKGKVKSIEMKRRQFKMHIPFDPPGATEHYIKFFGPVKMVFDTLDDDKKSLFRKDLTKLWNDYNTSKQTGSTVIDTEYLEVKAVK
jgi:SAM-dependent methyltransferase